MRVKVVDIMRVNVDKVLERDQKLSELDNRAGNWTTAPWLLFSTVSVGVGTVVSSEHDQWGCLEMMRCFQFQRVSQKNA